MFCAERRVTSLSCIFTGILIMKTFIFKFLMKDESVVVICNLLFWKCNFLLPLNHLLAKCHWYSLTYFNFSLLTICGLFLFRNYVVQYVLDLKNPMIIAKLASQFEGYYVNLSIQKFSSNVVEKCLKVVSEDHRAKIILELISVPRFELLIQDPFANYVIQSALQSSKVFVLPFLCTQILFFFLFVLFLMSSMQGSLHAALVDAIRPHASHLRTSPFCKRIFSRAQLKKWSAFWLLLSCVVVLHI